ncbi:collagen alpha-1(VI) chain-like [Mantella aurantiaca]
MLMFILDSSESVGLSNFTLQKEFILRVITKITKKGRKTELGGTRIGVIQYSHGGKQELLSTDDPNIKTLSKFKSAVKEMSWIAGGTYTGEALDLAKKTLQGSILTHKVVVVLTDGRFDSRDPKSLTSLCTISNLNVIAIGVGDKLMKPPMMKVLQKISCAGTRNEGIHIDITEYHELLEESILHNITKYICRGSVCPDFTCHVEFDESTDILFLMDGSNSVGHSNFDEVKEFVKLAATKILSEEMNINNMLQLSVVQYSSARTQKLEVPFTSNIEDATSGLSKAIYIDAATDLPAALRYTTNYLERNGRPNVKRQIIIFSDGRSSGIAQNQIAAQAAAVLNPKTELFAITVGTFHELGICQLLSGKNSNFNFNQIEDKILRVLEYSDLRKRVTLQSFLKKITS